ncbi:6-hydroxypseudooxynicotine dehydrogenase complex subunit beta [Pirellulimonas nuda]|uniref:6-hydroxypseudooxynicotine dehydrogenase complex subunit beta n=1 Tax=Pirellulimonas nuda TaxID=2528009 RepID=A0A518DGZ5_9BACT|nr:FAD binding domain-containing protein [Pirellulimonas nuda]QDU90749.1 6-hydroxypseudooxynicotine dehydrogenase complex subunit beta [Pirellulimonas nuda]
MRDLLVIYVNGARHEVSGRWAERTLTEWLREGLRLVGTKVVCSEGDCGACSVLVGRVEAPGEALVYRTIDACIAFLYQLDRCHVVTVEGLRQGAVLSPVQRAMVDCHGSQCGFCTPGFVTTLHGMLEAQNGDPLTDEGLRYGLSGNLCRCTGYAQIIEAGRSIDPARVARIAELYDSKRIATDLAAIGTEDVCIEITEAGATRRVMIPTSLSKAIAWKAEFPAARLVSGATDLGVQRNHGKLPAGDVLYLGRVAGFDKIAHQAGALTMAAGATWRQVEQATRTLLPQLWAILTRFGSPQIRNLATFGGNLANASPIADSLPALYAQGAELELASARGRRRVPIESFYLGYKQLDLAADELIVAVHMPLPAEHNELVLAKVSKRRDMDISTVASAVWLTVEEGTIVDARVALGGVGPTVVRSPGAEGVLVGAGVEEETFRKAGRAARADVTPISDVRSSAAYRAQLVENLVARAFFEIAPQPVGA